MWPIAVRLKLIPVAATGTASSRYNNLLFSGSHDYYFPDARFKGAGCQHHPAHPAVLSLCADLLVMRAEAAAAILAEAALDNQIACESYSGQSGLVKTGAHFATCAGWFAY